MSESLRAKRARYSRRWTLTYVVFFEILTQHLDHKGPAKTTTPADRSPAEHSTTKLAVVWRRATTLTKKTTIRRFLLLLKRRNEHPVDKQGVLAMLFTTTRTAILLLRKPCSP